MAVNERDIRLRDRISIRLPDEITLNENFILDLMLTIEDRLNLRLGTIILPLQFESILVDAVVKMYRRKYYEGIVQERIETLDIRFVDDILDEYSVEIESYLNSSSKKNVVRFI